MPVKSIITKTWKAPPPLSKSDSQGEANYFKYLIFKLFFKWTETWVEPRRVVSPGDPPGPFVSSVCLQLINVLSMWGRTKPDSITRGWMTPRANAHTHTWIQYMYTHTYGYICTLKKKKRIPQLFKVRWLFQEVMAAEPSWLKWQ